MLGVGLGGSGGLFGGFIQPSISSSSSLGPVLSKQPVKYPVAVPTTRKDMASLSGAIEGGASGAGTGAAVGGGYGAIIGGVAGAIAGLFTKKKDKAAPATGAATTTGGASGGGGLLDALSSGLKSVGIPGLGGSSAQPMNITQTQSVNTDVNVNNVLGGRSFGGVDESGEFDTFQLLADVFSIKDAMAANANVSNSQGAGPVSFPAGEATSSPNLTQTALIAAGALAAIYFFTKGK